MYKNKRKLKRNSRRILIKSENNYCKEMLESIRE